MTTKDVAEKYYELYQQNKVMNIIEDFYSTDIVNREPEHAAKMGIPTLTVGLEAVKAKSKARREMIEQIHARGCSMPVVGGNFFSLSMWQDVTFKGKPMMKLDEIAVFEVKEGKIVSEQFFF